MSDMKESVIRVPIQLHNQVLACLRSKLTLANKQLNTQYSEPKVKYLKKGSIAGSAYAKDWLIQLNIVMLLENGPTFIEQVVPHELAHLLVFKQYGNKVKPHGVEWQYIMSKILQESPSVTHNFPTPKSKRATYLYRCDCQEYQLSTIRHRRIQDRQTQYFCKKCGKMLTFVDED